MPRDSSNAHRAGHSVARWTIGLLLACLALEAASIASGLSYRALLARLAAGAVLLPHEAAATDARARAIALLKLVAFSGAGVVWLTWLYRTYGNLTFVGSKRSRFTRAWAVGYWFIPFVNLVRAYQVMKDLWLRSDSLNDRDAYDSLPAPAFFSGWWGTSLTWGVLGPVVTFLERDARTPLELINATDMAMVVNAVGVLAGALAIKVVREIDRRQQCFDVSPTQHVGGATQRGDNASAHPGATERAPAPAPRCCAPASRASGRD